MYKWLILSAALLMMAQTPPVEAQSITVQPVLTANTSSMEQGVQLRNVSIQAEISGPFARTEIEMTFYNPNRRVLEGALEFPLLEGQTVTGFALDFDGKWRDAVAIEKPKAQQVFEDVTRQRVDPALLQVTRGNNYKVRVYPLPAQGIRRVKLVVSERLPLTGNERIYRLPLAYQNLARLRVNLVVHDADAVLRAPDVLGDLDFEPRSNLGQKLQIDRTGYSGSSVLEVAMPPSEDTETFVQSFQNQRYFMTVVPRPQVQVPRAVPTRVELWWDSSLSGLKRKHDAELALLDGYFKKFPDLKVKLVRFRDVAEPAEHFEVRQGDWSLLRRALESTVYDGGTRFDPLNCEADCTSFSERLLFTDGLDNMTTGLLAASPVPLYVVSSALSSDPVRLQHLAQSGGKSINLARLTPEQALQTLLTGQDVLQDLRATGARDLTVHEDPDAWVVAGVLTNSSAQLNYRLGGQDQTLRISSTAPRSVQVAQLWASWTTNHLLGEERFNEAAIRRLGKQFRLVTPQTSLIVLDTVQDYVRYEIEPPEELQAEYQRLLQEQEQNAAAQKQNHTEMVLGLLNTYEDWWKRDFPKGDPIKPELAKKAESSGPLPVTTPSTDASSRETAQTETVVEGMAFDGLEGSLADMSTSSAVTPAPSAPASTASAPASGNAISIQLKKWTPDAPYIRRMQEAKASDLYRIYLDERPSYENSTAFYLDAADQLFEKKLPELALRVLSNLSELELENRSILRIQAYRYLQAGYPDLALPILEQVLKLAPYEPQSFRDLGLAYQQAHNHQKAIENLYRVVEQGWDARFNEIELIALNELNALLGSSDQQLDTSFMDPRLLKNLPVDLRVVLTWDADNTDMDLWVTDPNNERVYYGHRLSYQGGRISRDMTGGYGPEEFTLKKAKPGKYTIQVDYYGNNQQIIAGAVTLQAKLVTHFGTRAQKEQLVTLRLKDRKENVFVGEFEVK